MSKTDKQPNFENSLSRLEQIVQAMESGDLPLEKMIEHFEEGSKHVEQCTKQLNKIEQRIEKLVKKDGSITTEPFEPTDSEP